MAFHDCVAKLLNIQYQLVPVLEYSNTFLTLVADLPLVEEDRDSTEIKPIQLP